MSDLSPVRSVIMFNGPPGCGKDYATSVLVRELSLKGTAAHHLEVKNRLIDLTCLIHDMDRDEWDRMYHHPTKDMPLVQFGGMSMRQALIRVSETVIKPNYGLDYFGRAAGKTLKDGVNVFSDGGFEPEIRAIIKSVGEDNFLLIRVHPIVDGEAKGFEGSGDSRSYVMGEGIPAVDVTNDYTQLFTDTVMDAVAPLMNRHESRCAEEGRSDLIIPVVHQLSKASADLVARGPRLQD